MGHNDYTSQERELIEFSETLKKNSERFFQNLGGSVFVFDLKGRFVFFNQAAEKLLGYERNDVLGQHFRLLLTLDDLSDGFLFLYQTLNGCYTEQSRFRFRRKDGSTLVLEITAGPIYHSGKVRAALAIAHDMSGQTSGSAQDVERVKIFKKFSNDLAKWSDASQKF